ncbi:pheST operon leader peptide PheM [Rahnella sp. CG8]|nr:pheST operon leader peptide PheM [Rahnella sp. CG8]
MLPLLYFVFKNILFRCLIPTVSFQLRHKIYNRQGNASMNAAIFRFFFYFSA